MAQPYITGSFFDLQHVNLWDAAYWTDRCRFWTEESWRALMADMHGLGIDTAICGSTALWGRPLFGGYEATVGIPLLMGCEEPLAACVDEADRLGMQMYFGVGLRGRVSQVRDYATLAPPWTEEWFRWNAALAAAIVDRFGGRRCFAGLYLAYEIDFEDHHVELYERLIRRWLRPAVGRVPLLASPGSLGTHADLAVLARQLERMDLDILAPQDYGGRSNVASEALERVQSNAAALAAAGPLLQDLGITLWVNCEFFNREYGPDGRPRCIPGPIARVRDQYQGIMNRRTALVDIGAPGSDTLYNAYQEYLRDLRT